MSILTRHALHLPRTLARLVGDGYTYEELFPRYLHVLKPPSLGRESDRSRLAREVLTAAEEAVRGFHLPRRAVGRAPAARAL